MTARHALSTVPDSAQDPARARQQASLAQAIEAHLAAHPNAADSVDGVLKWWLPARGIQASLLDVEEALATMVARQRIRSVRLADGTVLYSRRTAPSGP